MVTAAEITEILNEMPFHKLLGLKVNLDNINKPYIRIDMRPELIGNTAQQILHGGAISSTLDFMGGMTAVFDLMKQNGKIEHERLSKIGTIDLRIDYLRPGRGEYFIATGCVLRTGNKISVTRMELKNDKDILIAVGTGTYLVG